MKKRMLAAVILAVAAMVFLFLPRTSEDYSVSSEGVLSYAQDRPPAEFEKAFFRETANFTQHRLIFDSKGKKIYSYLYVPKQAKRLSIIILPGGNVDKNREAKVSETFADLGYTVMTLDQRGVGETGGIFTGIDQDFFSFSKGVEPNSFLMVYDVLRAFDTLKEMGDGKVIILGESMGGRFGIIAAALDPNISGLITVSSAGFGTVSVNDEEQRRFFSSINPDTYIGKISPRKVVMLHYRNDTTVPFKNGYLTFEKADMPKDFYALDSCSVSHGYCAEMLPYISRELELFEKAS